MFIELLSTYIIRSFCKSLAFNSKGTIKFVSLDNQPCQARSTLIDLDSSKMFLLDDLYARICVPDKVKIWI